MEDQARTDGTDGTDRTDRTGRGTSHRGGWFSGGLLVGLALGIAATLAAPQLLPQSAPDCVRPERVVWSQEGGSVSTEVTYADDGTDGCQVQVVFQEPAARR